jgi:hypothetical protein
LQIRSAVLKPGQTLEIGVLEFELSGPSGGGSAPAKEAATTRGTQVLTHLSLALWSTYFTLSYLNPI